MEKVVTQCSTFYDDDGLRDRTVDICFKYADTDADGYITKDEYMQWVSNTEQMRLYKSEVTNIMSPVTQNCNEILRNFISTSMTKYL